MEKPGTAASATGEKSVLLRGLAILECFADSGPEQTVSAIANRTGLPPATTHRLLAVLVDWGAVERTARGRYRLGVRLWRLGALVPHTRTLRDIALPYLEDLYEATRGVVHLAIVDGVEALYVEKISGRGAVSVTSSVGRRLPLYAAGPGKVLIAFSGPNLLERVIAAGLHPRTPYTITSESALRRALAEIRRTGFAVSREEMSIGNASVAAPIFDARGSVAASVAVVTRPELLNVPVMGPLVKATGRGISHSLARPAAG